MNLPYYHIVSDDWIPHVSPLYHFRNVREFGRDLDWFLMHGVPLGLTDFLAVTTSGEPPPKNSFFLTFDDGFREVFDVIRPILRAKGVPAIFFVTSGTVDNNILCLHQKIALILDFLVGKPDNLDREIANRLAVKGVRASTASNGVRSLTYSQDSLVDEIASVCGIDFAAYLRSTKPYLTTEQIAVMLTDGFGFGAHSIDHPLYSSISLDEQIRQTQVSMSFLVDRFALKYRLFAFPHSDSNVSGAFFEKIHSNDAIRATFGTSAPHVDRVARSFQRFSMEKTKRSAASVVALQTLRRIKHRLTGQSLIKRD